MIELRDEDVVQCDQLLRAVGKARFELTGVECIKVSDSLTWLAHLGRRLHEAAQSAAAKAIVPVLLVFVAELARAQVGGSTIIRGNTDGTPIGNVTDRLNVSATQSGTWSLQTVGVPGAALFFGDVTTAATTEAVVRRTAYTEPASAAQFSIRSANAADTAAGTGARTVAVTWSNGTLTSKAVENITLNGTTCVNSAATTARFFDKMQVATVGSSNSNTGILTLFTGAGCVTTVGTIGALAEQTFWAHYYVLSGKTANLTGAAVSHNGTTTGSGAQFVVRGVNPLVANENELQVLDVLRLYGQSSTVSRDYTSPIPVVGPKRLNVYVTPETSSSTVYRAAIDFFEP